MDWGRAKNILIIGFLITNIILVSNIIVHFNGYGNNDMTAHIEEVKKILETKNIFIYTEIPKQKKTMAVLKVNYYPDQEAKIERWIRDQNQVYDNITENLAKEIARNFIAKNDLKEETMVFAKVKEISNGYEVIYKNRFKGIFIEESYLKCEVNQNGISRYEKIWLEPLELGENEKETMTATTALLKFMKDAYPYEDELIITDMQLVYWLDTRISNLENMSSDTALPAWRIEYNDGKEKYIFAYEN